MKPLFILSFITVATAVQFEIVNREGGPVWAGILGNDGKPPLEGGGFILNSGESRVINTPDDQWAGRFWCRTWCDPNTQYCQTGDCGSKIECNGAGGEPPASLAEITLRGDNGNDFYDLSLVDGYNVKISMEPVNGQGDCKSIKCVKDLKDICPEELKKLGGDNGQQTIGCYSACSKFNQDDYCCRGQYGTPETCNPDNWNVNYAKIFKEACPDAYSYAYDDQTSTFTCVADKYIITCG